MSETDVHDVEQFFSESGVLIVLILVLSLREKIFPLSLTVLILALSLTVQIFPLTLMALILVVSALALSICVFCGCPHSIVHHVCRLAS